MDAKSARADDMYASDESPKVSFLLPFEDSIKYEDTIKPMADYFHLTVAVVFTFHLPLIYLGPMFMRNRQSQRLRGPLIFWNLCLALFSMIGFLRTWPEMYHVLTKFGFKHSICKSTYKYSQPTYFWMLLFVLSKVPELIDTVFLVLRKQNLIFLHVWHHATVCMVRILSID